MSAVICSVVRKLERFDSDCGHCLVVVMAVVVGLLALLHWWSSYFNFSLGDNLCSSLCVSISELGSQLH